MAKKKQPISVGKLVITGLIVFGISAAGTWLYLNWTSGTHAPTPPEKPYPAAATTTPQERKVTVYVPEATKTAFYLVPKTRTADSEGDILDAAVRAMIATGKETGEAGALIPKGTRLLSPVKVDHGVATVDLSVEFVNNFRGGTTQEALTLNSIAYTLVKNSGGKVKEVRILIEGKPAEPLGGDYDLKDPITPDPAWLKPGE